MLKCLEYTHITRLLKIRCISENNNKKKTKSQLEPHIIIFSIIKYPLERSAEQFSGIKNGEPIDFLLCNYITIRDI